MNNSLALEVEALTVCYDQHPVLWDINLSIPKGKLVAIVGPNGAGKSTLIKAILGLTDKLKGEIKLLGEPFAKVRESISYVPQRESVDWDFPITVERLVMMGRYGSLGWFKRPSEKDWECVNNALEQVSLTEYRKRQISQLSGGQQQRAFLARALAQQAAVYLMDEPFSAIDTATERQLAKVMRELAQKGSTLFVVHHDLSTVEAYFDWVILLNGRLVASGPTKEIFTPEILAETYGRPMFCCVNGQADGLLAQSDNVHG